MLLSDGEDKYHNSLTNRQIERQTGRRPGVQTDRQTELKNEQIFFKSKNISKRRDTEKTDFKTDTEYSLLYQKYKGKGIFEQQEMIQNFHKKLTTIHFFPSLAV